MLETGSVRLKNTLAIMLKNVLDACVSALMWFVLGESIMVDGTNSFLWASSRSVLLIGRDTDSPADMATWFLNFGEWERQPLHHGSHVDRGTTLRKGNSTGTRPLRTVPKSLCTYVTCWPHALPLSLHGHGDHYRLRRHGGAHPRHRVPGCFRGHRRVHLPLGRTMDLASKWLVRVATRRVAARATARACSRDSRRVSPACNPRLSVRNPDAFLGGMVDWAGSCAIHLVGGAIALVGAAIVGPRRGRFDSVGKPVPMPGSNAALQVRRLPAPSPHQPTQIPCDKIAKGAQPQHAPRC